MSTILQETLARAVRTLLRPLVRILLRNGIPHATLVEYAKQAYVDVAAGDFAVPGRKPSISRISVLTGLTRKEVSRLLKSDDEPGAAVERYHRADRILTAWAREPVYRDGSGRPALLSVEGAHGFADLVRRHGADVPHRAMLDELLRVAAVEHTRDGRLRLLNRAYIPSAGQEDKLAILGTDVSDLINSIDHNLTHPPEEAFFQRKVAYDNLVTSSLPEIRDLARRRSQALLEALDREMAPNDRDANPRLRGSAGNRVVVGIHYLEQASEEDES